LTASGKRVLTSQADTAIAKGIEAGLGATWGEDPRPLRSNARSVGSRIGFALKTVVLAPRPDGRLAPAWGRVAGAVGSNVVQNAWLPSHQRTFEETSTRVGFSLVGRLASNLWTEFGPDLRRRFGGRSSSRER